MTKLSRKQFIEKVSPFAIATMKITKIPASLIIAQAILESADGNSGLSTKANNLFGIKGTGTDGSIIMSTIEFVNGKTVTVNATFRKYNNWGESVTDHSKLITGGVSWNHQLYHGVINKDGKTAAIEIAKAGYATDPKYSTKLIDLMIQNDLLKYDIIESPKDELTELKKSLESLSHLVTRLTEQLNELYNEQRLIPIPSWLLEEFPNALEFVNENSGSKEFWRNFAISLRIQNRPKSTDIS